MASLLNFDTDCDNNKNQFLFNNNYHHLSANFTYDIMSDVSSTFGKFDNINYSVKTKQVLDKSQPLPKVDPYVWQDDQPPPQLDIAYVPQGNNDTRIIIDTTYGKTFKFYAIGTTATQDYKFNVDWGDGTTTKGKKPTTAGLLMSHDYSNSNPGRYRIRIRSANVSKRAITTLKINTATEQNGNIICIQSIENGITTISPASFYNEPHMIAFNCCENTTLKTIDYIFVKSTTVVNDENSWNIIDSIILSGSTAIKRFPLYDGTTDANTRTYFPKLKKIGYKSFYGCKALTTLDVSRTSIEMIEKDACRNCTALTAFIGFANTSDERFNHLNYIGARAFSNCAFKQFGPGTNCSPLYYSSKRNSNITTPIKVASTAFNGCKSLATVSKTAFNEIDPSFKRLSFMPEYVTTIANSAISKNDGIEEIVLPCQLTQQGPAKVMFGHCSELTSITFSNLAMNGILSSTIGYLAYDCPKLKTVIFPNRITYIVNSVPLLLSSVPSLETIIYPDSLSALSPQFVMNGNSISAVKNIKLPFIGKSRYGSKDTAVTNNVSGDTNKLIGSVFNSQKTVPNEFYYPVQVYQSDENGTVKTFINKSTIPVSIPKTLENLSVGCFLWMHSGAFSGLSSLKTITFTDPPINQAPFRWSGLSAFYGCHNLVSVIFTNMQHTLFDEYGFSEGSYNANKFPPLQGETEKHKVRYVFSDGYYEWDSPNGKYAFYQN